MAVPPRYPFIYWRLPISIKLCDRNLFDEAAEYDQDVIELKTNDKPQEGIQYERFEFPHRRLR